MPGGPEPSVEEIVADLKALHEHTCFNGLITFGADGALAKIPKLAKDVGFSAVIMGIYVNPAATEWNLIQVESALAQDEWVDAFVYGHLNLEQIDFESLANGLRELKSRTKKPVSTTLPFIAYIGDRGAQARELGDFLIPDVHGSWRGGATPSQLVDELRSKIERLADVLPGRKPVLLKMISYPSGGADGLTPENQRDFFKRVLRDVDVPDRMYKSFFPAFDPHLDAKTGSSWSATEEHAGLFTNDRIPKIAAKESFLKHESDESKKADQSHN